MKSWAKIYTLQDEAIRRELSRQLRSLSIFSVPEERHEEIERLARQLEKRAKQESQPRKRTDLGERK